MVRMGSGGSVRKPVGQKRPVREFETGELVRRTELSGALDQFRQSVKQDMDHRFKQNEQAMESLRVLIGRTDSMLERVLENLESAQS